MDVNLVRCFTGVSCRMSWILSRATVYKKTLSPKSQFAKDVLKQTKIIFQDVQKNTMLAYVKNKAYFDKKN